ncbi:MAG: ACT domain-containing protein, partial [bacterium]
ISFTVPAGDLARTMGVVKGAAARLGAEDVQADENVAKVSIIGIGMRSHSGVAASMFEALAQAGINIQMISTSEIKISCVIEKPQMEQAVKVLHRRFRLERDQVELGEPFLLEPEKVGVRTANGAPSRRRAGARRAVKAKRRAVRRR